MTGEHQNGELDVSVILPAYNEEDHILEEIDRIQEALRVSPYSFEIIVINDGSTDGTSALLQGRDDIELIEFETNHGSGYARRIGTSLARGNTVVWTDADMSYPNHEIATLVKDLEGYDQIVGARTSERGTLRVLRIPAKWVIRKLASFLTATRIPDLNSGLRAFRREVGVQYLHLLPDGFSCVTTLSLSFISNGYSIKYVPIEYSPRSGQSKFHWYRDTRKYLLQVVRMTMMFNPMRVLMPIGVFLLTVGVAKAIYDLITKDFRLGTNTLALLLASMGIGTVALLADLVVQVSKSPRQVPPAMVRRHAAVSNIETRRTS